MENSMVKIQTEGTPNPNALKFVVNRILLNSSTKNFSDKSKCSSSPLATKLFNINSIKEVFIARDFITITKEAESNWDTIYGKIVEVITSHLESNEAIITSEENQKKEKSGNDIIDKIHEILDSQIRPAVASDGGDIIFDSYEDGILKLHLQGACSSCPSSAMTLRAGVESMLKKYIPEIKQVVSV